MKKYTSVIVSSILVVVALICTLFIGGDAVKAGAGNGRNAKVKSMEQMSGVLSYISGGNYYDGADYRSATWTEDTVINMTYEQQQMTGFDPYNGGATYTTLGTVSTKMNRTLTCYMMGDVSLYRSKGTAKSSFSSNSYSREVEDQSAFMNFDMDVYIGEELCMICISELTVNSNGEGMVIRPALKGKWIQVPYESAGELLEMVDEMNRDFLGQLQGYLEEAQNGEGGFKHKGDKYTKEDKDDLSSLRVLFDFSDDECPYLEYEQKAKNKEGDNQSYLYDSFTFENVNNTVIEVVSEPDYVCETEQDFEDLFE